VKTGLLAVISPAKYRPSSDRWQSRPQGPEEELTLVAQLELLRNRLIPIHIDILQIIEQTAPLTDHHQQPPSGAMVFLVLLQMFGQMIDSLCQQRNLDVSRTCIFFVQLKIAYCLRFCFHTYQFNYSVPR
jgi:hypothetical protein